jgi:hypothetical protein
MNAEPLEVRRQALVARIALQRVQLRSDVAAFGERAPVTTVVNLVRMAQVAAACWKVGQLAWRVASLAMRRKRR